MRDRPETTTERDTMNTEFHPNSEIPTSYKPGQDYTCQACGEEDALSIWTNDDGIVVGKCYGGCY